MNNTTKGTFLNVLIIDKKIDKCYTHITPNVSENRNCSFSKLKMLNTSIMTTHKESAKRLKHKVLLHDCGRQHYFKMISFKMIKINSTVSIK